MNKNILSWALFDFAETIFSANIISVFFPLIIVSYFGGKSYHYSFTYSLSIVFAIFIGLILGKFADKHGLKLKIFKISILAIFSLLVALSFANNLIYALFIFFILNISYQTALIFYNSILNNLSKKNNISFISGLGVGIGYIGGILALVITNLTQKEPHNILMFTAIIFAIFSFPSLFLLKIDVPKINVNFSLKSLLKDKTFLLFIISIFFLTDAIHGVIIFMSLYLHKVFAFETGQVISVIALAGIFAVISAPFIGKLCDYIFNPIKSLKYIILFWFFGFLALIISNKYIIYIVGAIFGILIASSWTLLRVILIKISPSEQISSRFALFSASSKFASILSPLIWGIITYTFNDSILSYKLSVLAISIFPLIGFFIYNKFLENLGT